MPTQPSWLRYRVGPRAHRRLLADGLGPQTLGGLLGPASGPKWLALAGLDRAILQSGWLQRPPGRPPVQLLGASAGAWRMLAYATAQPAAALGRLQDGYIGQAFTKEHTAAQISDRYRTLIREVAGERLDAVLTGSACDLAIVTSRIRGLRSRAGMTVSLLTAAALHWVTPRGTDWLFERVLFHSRPRRAKTPRGGRLVQLDENNLLEAVLASGTVPFYLQTIEDLPGAPAGAYIDGGLTDYHVNAATMPETDGIWLLPHYWRRVVPRWLDKGRQRRDLTAQQAQDVLQLYPSDAFVASLPSGQLPDREDFKTFADRPQIRMQRWREVVARSELLGAELLRDVETGAWRDKLEVW